MERFPLDEETINLLAEIQAQQQQLEQQFNLMNAQRRGVLLLFLRQHKLPGNWTVDTNGRELVEVEQPQPAAKPHQG